MTEQKIDQPQPVWVARKAAFDAMDDGCGPYMEWAWKDEDEQARRRAYWPDFLAWAEDHMGQGYSLACCEGSLVDPITSYCFHGYVVGREAEQGAWDLLDRASRWLDNAHSVYVGAETKPTNTEELYALTLEILGALLKRIEPMEAASSARDSSEAQRSE